MNPNPGPRAAVAPVLGALAILAASGCADPATTTPAPLPALAHATESAAPAPEPLVSRTTLGRGGTLTEALARLEVDGRAQQRMLAGLADNLDLRRLSPHTGLAAVRDADGRLRHVAVRAADDSYLRVAATAQTEVQNVALRFDRELESVAGVVEQSVAQALGDSPHGAALTLAFAEIFQWDIDLLIEPRPGDEIRVVHEVRRLRDPPFDLPRFGNAPQSAGQVAGLGRIVAASYHGRVARANAFWVEGPAGDGDYYDTAGRPLRKSFLKSPLNYRRISSRFSHARRNPVTRRVVPHHGVDYAAAAGTPVVAAADGRVISAGWAGALGRTIKIRHGSEYVTVYGHLRGFARGIRGGVEVRQNQLIGYVGDTGRATGPHLHYTVLLRGRAIDPLRMENPPVAPLDPALTPHLERAVERFAASLGLDREATGELARHAPSSLEPPRAPAG